MRSQILCSLARSTKPLTKVTLTNRVRDTSAICDLTCFKGGPIRMSKANAKQIKGCAGRPPPMKLIQHSWLSSGLRFNFEHQSHGKAQMTRQQ